MPRVGVDPAMYRNFMLMVRSWFVTLEKTVSEEAVKEQAKQVLKDAVTETVKETAKEAIREAVESRADRKTEKSDGAGNKAKKSELDGIKLIVQEALKASPETETIAEEIRALKDFVASVLADTTASATANHLDGLTLLMLVGGAAAVVVVGGYMLHQRRRGTAASRGRAGAAQPAALGLLLVLHSGGPARRRIDAALAVPTTVIAAADRAPPASHPAPPASEKHIHKNRLQSFAERTYKMLPTYKVEFEGESHQPKFRCTVEVCGKQFSSAGSFDHKKEAEQDAARIAYEILTAIGEDDIKEAFGLIDEDVVFCKSILYEFAVKTKTTWPSYSIVCLIKPLTLFRATVVFDGNSYTGEFSHNKRDAELNAARAAIKSFLAKHNTCMVGIVRSKKQLITAVKSCGNTQGGADHIAPVLQNASSSLAVQGGNNAVPGVGTLPKPSSANVSRSKKRKGRV